MLERLQVLNFQGLEKLRIKFDPQITAITGPSDVGKSSSLRAIRWIVENRPLGDSFIRHGSDCADVRLWIDGTAVRRKRDGAVTNLYKIGDYPDLEAFGTNVPEDVTSTLQLGPVNFQDQLDPPFWFSLTAGEVAKQLNSIVDLDCIDRAISDVQSRVRKASSEVDITKSRLSEAETQVEDLEWALEADEDYQDVETFGDKSNKLESFVSNLSSRLDICDRYSKRHQAMVGMVEEFQPIIALWDSVDGLELCVSELGDFLLLVEKSSIEVPDIAELESLHSTFVDMVEALQDMKEAVRGVNQWTTESETLNEQLADLMAEQSRFKSCPLCGGAL